MEIISMMDIKVQHRDPSIQISPLLTIPVSVIPESSLAPTTTIPPPIPPFISPQQQSTPIPIPTTTEATTLTTAALDFETHSAIHLRVSDLEKEVKELKNVDYSSRHTAELIKEHSVPADVVEVLQQQQQTQKSAEDIRKIRMEQAGSHQQSKYTITSSDKAALKEFDQKRTLFETMTKSKSFERNSKHKALYHALMESILADEDAMDKGVADIQKKRKPDDADRDEDPPARPDQGLKRRNTSKDTKQSKKAKSIRTSKGTTKSQPKSTSKSAQAEETMFEAGDTQADPKDWFKKPERPPTPDLEWNEGKTVDNKTTHKWLSDLAKAETSSKTFDDLISTLIDFNAFVMNCMQISERYPFDLSKPLPLVQSRNCHIVPVDYFFNNDLAYLSDQQLYKFMEGDFPRLHQNDIDDMLLLIVQNKLFNIKGEDIVHLAAALRVIYEDKLNRKRLMRSDELYKFSDRTLQSVQDTLHDMATNLRMGYNKAMPKRR
ncbi:hypothetical protein Tco_1449300 [Tanacetum coccineum]